MKKIVLLVALCMMTMVAGYAQEPSKVEAKIAEIVKKYENTEGVDSMSVVKGKGFGFGFVKMMFTAQFGKEFMKGVTALRSLTMAMPQRRFVSLCVKSWMFSNPCLRSLKWEKKIRKRSLRA